MTNSSFKTFNSLTSINRERRQYVHDICRLYNRSPSKGNLKKLKLLFNKFGSELIIEQGFHCDYGDKISFGERVYLNINCTLLDAGQIEIGNDALVGPNVQMITVNHPTDPQSRLDKTSLIDDIVIGDNVWIGAGAILLAGVKVGNNAVIAAGSVVNRDVAANCLVAGNPAKWVKDL